MYVYSILYCKKKKLIKQNPLYKIKQFVGKLSFIVKLAIFTDFQLNHDNLQWKCSSFQAKYIHRYVNNIHFH